VTLCEAHMGINNSKSIWNLNSFPKRKLFHLNLSST
jgi:hypothetical protein